MSGPTIKIHIYSNVVKGGHTQTHAHPTPLARDSQGKADRDVKLGIIKKIPIGVPTTWQSRMVWWQRSLENLVVKLRLEDTNTFEPCVCGECLHPYDA